jgi:NAD(P)-dependent dehydrogenase (short-subunit alcohol dehydrogenase family)
MVETNGNDIAVVSGATGGIGSSIVEQLARKGATVVMLGRDLERLRVTKKRISENLRENSTLTTLELDVNSLESVERGIAAVLDQFGRIDVLVNAAGDGPASPLLETTDELWMGTVNSKLLGTIRLTRSVARAMVARRSGRIVVINGSFRKEPDPLFPINGTVNAGLAAFAKAISHDLGYYGIRVNVVDPGATDTPLWRRTLEQLAERFDTSAEAVNKGILDKTPLGSLPTPRDVAELVSFLVSDSCRYVTGAAITVDGGASVAL